MTQDKHTLGPLTKSGRYLWSSLCQSDKDLQTFLIVGPDDKTIAIIPLWPDKVEEQEANTILFASAPTLQSRIDRLKDELKANIIVMDAASTKIDRLEAEKAELVKAHQAISSLHGNMSLDSIERVGGINDGRDRAIKLRAAIEISRTALSKHTPVSEQGGEQTNPKPEV